jgi:hypothetical protein
MLDGAYVPVNNLERSYRIPRYPNLRESDVLWKKRVWEDINGNEKMNYPIFLPVKRTDKRYALWHVIEDGINGHFLTPYEASLMDATGFSRTANDEFSKEIGGVSTCKGGHPALCKYDAPAATGTPNASMFPQLFNAAGEFLVDSDQDGWPDPEWLTLPFGSNTPVPAQGDPKKHDPAGLGRPNLDDAPSEPGLGLFGCPSSVYTADSIVGYRLKEDWIFDKQRSTRFVRIIGIAPLVPNGKGSSSTLVYKAFENEEVRPLFWLHYASCRSWFAQWDVYNMSNDAFRGSFDDLFEMRRFSAHVVKEENVFDRKIQDYAQGLDALLEGERIKKEIFEYEHDLWNY